MPRHKFTVGQEVSFLPSAMDFNVPRGTYRIVRQLPLEAGGFQDPGEERKRRPRTYHPRKPARGRHHPLDPPSRGQGPALV